MTVQSLLNLIANPFMKLVLHSPLHGLVSGSTLLITFTGRKSGKVFTTPTNYLRDGNTISIVSFRSRTWWRNLRGGAPVTLRLQGRDMKGQGAVIEDDEGVVAALTAYLQKAPSYAKFLQVTLDANDQPNAKDVARAARQRVLVHIKLA
jgi:deazaflavin-dependent oxidoreductase (nitroreductase family)